MIHWTLHHHSKKRPDTLHKLLFRFRRFNLQPRNLGWFLEPPYTHYSSELGGFEFWIHYPTPFPCVFSPVCKAHPWIPSCPPGLLGSYTTRGSDRNPENDCGFCWLHIEVNLRKSVWAVFKRVWALSLCLMCKGHHITFNNLSPQLKTGIKRQ